MTQGAEGGRSNEDLKKQNDAWLDLFLEVQAQDKIEYTKRVLELMDKVTGLKRHTPPVDASPACKRCGGRGYVENTVNPLSDEMTCPDCNDIPVDDKLAKARAIYEDSLHDEQDLVDAYESAIRERDEKIKELKERYAEHEEKEAACCPEDVGFDEMIASLKKKMSQMMTVEELKRWHGEWYESDSHQALTESLYEMIVRKIKERNEARK